MFSAQELQEFPVSSVNPVNDCNSDKDFPIPHNDDRGFFVDFTSTIYNKNYGVLLLLIAIPYNYLQTFTVYLSLGLSLLDIGP